MCEQRKISQPCTPSEARPTRLRPYHQGSQLTTLEPAAQVRELKPRGELAGHTESMKEGEENPGSFRKNRIRLDPAKLEALFCYKESEAAKILGISLTAMKRACRRAGITKWPYSRSRAGCRPGLPSASTRSSSPATSVSPCALGNTGEMGCEGWGWGPDESPLEVEWIEWYMNHNVEEDSEASCPFKITSSGI